MGKISIKEIIEKLRLRFSLPAVILIFLFLATATLYTTSFPENCARCHSENASTLSESSHKDSHCYECHAKGTTRLFEQKISEGFKMSYFFIISQPSLKPITAQVPNKNCLNCHKSILEKKVLRNAIYIEHKECLLDNALCTDCHSATAHKQSLKIRDYPTMDKCTIPDCHNGKAASDKCANCHASEQKREIRHTGPWVITHGPKWEQTHGMGELVTCFACHETKTYCAKCHLTMPHPKNWPGIHGQGIKEGAQDKKKDCLNCHREDFCENCHQIEMPHIRNFLKLHPDSVEKLGESNCLNCHIKQDCKDCHSRHTHPGISPEKLRGLQ